MTKSSTELRATANAAKGLIFAALVLPLGIASAPALASGNIQMLPPVLESTKLSATPTPCPPGGVPNILTWDGTNPISCSTGVTVSGGNVGIGTTVPGYALDVNGSINVTGTISSPPYGRSVLLGVNNSQDSSNRNYVYVLGEGNSLNGGAGQRWSVTGHHNTFAGNGTGAIVEMLGHNNLIKNTGTDSNDVLVGEGNTMDGFGHNSMFGYNNYLVGSQNDNSTVQMVLGANITGTQNALVIGYGTTMVFPGTGGVGIGSTQPQATLDVNGYVYIGTNGTAVEDQACSPNGLVGRDSTGALFDCQNNTWGRPQTFTKINTTIGAVDAACVAGGDPYPPNYNLVQYIITCATRYCETTLNYGFGLETENSASGCFNSTYPYQSTSTCPVEVVCSR